MATSTGFTLTPTRVRTVKGITEVWGTLAVAAGDYATNGLALPLNRIEGIHTRGLPMFIKIRGKNGWTYLYVDGTSLSDGKVLIRGQEPTNLTAGILALIEMVNATVLPASVTGDAFRFYGVFKFND